MNIFDKAMEVTFRWEGGYADDPDDSGGVTNYGITWKTLKSWRENQKQEWKGKKEEIKNLTKEEAKKIYRSFYWDPIKADNFQESIACELFDAGVNCGIRNAGIFLQNALNLLNLDNKLFADLKVDGVIGSKTIEAYNILMSRGQNEVSFLLGAIRGERYYYYRKIIFLRPVLEKFFRSWLRRII